MRQIGRGVHNGVGGIGHRVLHRAGGLGHVGDAQGRACRAPVVYVAGIGGVEADHRVWDQAVVIVPCPARQATCPAERPDHVGAAIGLRRGHARRIGRDILERGVGSLDRRVLGVAGRREAEMVRGQPAHLHLDALGPCALDDRRQARQLGAVLAIAGQGTDQGSVQKLDLHPSLGQVAARQPRPIGDQARGEVSGLADLQGRGLGVADIGHQADGGLIGQAGAVGRLAPAVGLAARHGEGQEAGIVGCDVIVVIAAAQGQGQVIQLDVAGEEQARLAPRAAVVILPLKALDVRRFGAEGAVDDVGGRRAEGDVAAVDGDHAAVEALAPPSFEPAIAGADDRLGAHRSEVALERVAGPRLPHRAVEPGRVAVRDKAPVLLVVIEQLQLQHAAVVEPLGQIEIEGVGAGRGEVCGADVHGARRQLGRAHPCVQSMVGVTLGDGAISDVERAAERIEAHLARG